MFSKNLDMWHVVFYDKVSLINKLYFYNVEIYNFKKIDNYKYCFETGRKNRSVIKKNFKDCKLISRKGFLNYIETIVTRTTFICILVASISLYNVSKRIWKIEIKGDYQEIEEVLKEELAKHNLTISEYYPDNNALKEIEGEISLYLSKDIEFLELRRSGAVITLRYQKRRVAQSLDKKGANLYATKDGMIRYFNVQSGVKQVKEYDYVRKGDLLVSDVVETSSGDLINVGALGSVFANTFYVIDVEIIHNGEDDASVFSKMLDKARIRVSEYLSKDENIEIERVLNYAIDKTNGKMKVYYMLLEDITI
jgi:similar to stage IV sporulation protein